MRVWIDMANSPHPLFFAPISRTLAAHGHELVVTARDHAQTAELARARWPEMELIGGESPSGKTGKLDAIASRARLLRRWAQGRGLDVALSHNSYAQALAARSLNLPVVTAMDFEHQPANHLAFRLAKTIVLPAVIPLEAIRRQGAAPRKIVRYPGLKEELYVGDFEPDRAILEKIGLRRRPPVLAVARTAPSGALYHNMANPLFDEAARMLSARDDVALVILPRMLEEKPRLEALCGGNCIIPDLPIDARSLMYAADVVVGAGGTMTREAAVMGIPTFSAYAGKPPAVDLWLERHASLVRLQGCEQLVSVGRRAEQPHDVEELRQRGKAIEQVIVDATLTASPPFRRRSLATARV